MFEPAEIAPPITTFELASIATLLADSLPLPPNCFAQRKFPFL
jgi:hypothetical protein